MQKSAVYPHSEYHERLEKWRAVYVHEARWFRTIGNCRLATGVVAAVLGWLALKRTITGWWLLVPLAVFIALVLWHERVARRQKHASRAADFYERGLARLEDRWKGAGNPGERFRDPSHLYAEDLDLFGKGSLFELLCTARTAAGEETLARWLLGSIAPGLPSAFCLPPSDLRARQEAVAELRPKLDLREDLAVLGEDVRAGVSAEIVTAWGTAPAVPFPRGARPLALGLVVLALASLGAYFAEIVPVSVFILFVIGELGFRYLLRHAVEQVVHSVEKPARDLKTLSMLLERLERESFAGAKLAELHRALEPHLPADQGTGSTKHATSASRLIAKLDRLVQHREWTENLIFRIPGFLLLWDEQYAIRIERWRRRWGGAIGRWIAAIGEMEALGSFAGYAYEHPSAPFAEFVEEGPWFEATALCHPLICPRHCVPNDLRLGSDSRLLIVSGSNMSGKSTLLRAVGLNTALAQAGAPVCAAALRLSPLGLGASIRVVDSLLDGRSRFYAEITRLRQILDLTVGTGIPARPDGHRPGPDGQECPSPPVLFLIDELLQGTNSHDRRIGAEAVLRNLVERGAIGLITTHDLALADIAQTLPGTVNVHFEDHLEDGHMRFDYRLRPGVVRRSNALELMRAVGLLQE